MIKTRRNLLPSVAFLTVVSVIELHAQVGTRFSPPVLSNANQKLSHDLPSSGDGPVDALVRYRTKTNAGHVIRVQSLGGTVSGQYSEVKSQKVRMKMRDLRSLMNDLDTVIAAPDRPVKVHLDYGTTAIGSKTAETSYGYTGKGVGVAVIDSGIANHPDFQQDTCTGSRIVYSENFVTTEKRTDDPFGHGTHVAGIIAGNGRCSGAVTSYRGVAPQANLINLRAIDATGMGYDSWVIAAINRAIALKDTYNIQVINLSLGRPVSTNYYNDPLCLAVEDAYNAGITVVVSAGNYGRNGSTLGYATIGAPGNDPVALTVGAANHVSTLSRGDDIMTTFSSKGPSPIDHIVKPDVIAPGNKIASALSPGSNIGTTFSANSITINGTKRYIRLSGTSMSTPFVSGAVALLNQKWPWLSPDTVKVKLMKTATKGFTASALSYFDPITGVQITPRNDIFTVGAGYIDVVAALNSYDNFSSYLYADSPQAYVDNAGKVKLYPDSRSVWFYNSLNLSVQAWGSTLLSGTTVTGSNSIVWGDGSVRGFSIVWGDSATMPDSIVWGDRVNTLLVLGNGDR